MWSGARQARVCLMAQDRVESPFEVSIMASMVLSAFSSSETASRDLAVPQGFFKRLLGGVPPNPDSRREADLSTRTVTSHHCKTYGNDSIEGGYAASAQNRTHAPQRAKLNVDTFAGAQEQSKQ